MAGSKATMEQALAIANEAEVNAYGYVLLQAKRNDEAIAIFERNVKQHPESWNTYDSLGEAFAAKGDKAKAATNYKKALAMAPAGQKARIQGILAGLS
jgi:predicted Zn-dependent protease